MVVAAVERKGKMVVAAAGSNSSDDEVMRQRVRENLKYLEELGISRDFLQFAKREYKLWVDGDEEKKLRYYRTSSSSTNQNAGRGYTGRIVSGMQRVAAIERAEKLQRDLKSHHHSFVKPMVRSHVSGCFWLGLPRSFCVDILPPTDLRMILEDVKGKEHNVLYLGRKNGLSGGWRGFAMDHNLEDGDAIVFELSQPARFKVHIVKAIEEEARESDEAMDGVNATWKTEKPKLKKDGAAAAAKTEKSRLKKKDQPVSQKRSGSPKKGGRPAKRARNSSIYNGNLPPS